MHFCQGGKLMALHHVASGETYRLASVEDPGAKTAALVKTDGFEVAQLVLRQGDVIAAHAVPGYATVHCLEGSVTLDTAEPVTLSAGDWIYLDRGEAHSVTANQDSSLLVTILFG
jgi:quercetin dioxygenase-like cupin family protein